MKSFNFASETNSTTYDYMWALFGEDRCCTQGGAHSGSSVFSSERLKKPMSPYFIKGTHSCYGANVVGDGDQSRSGEVLFTDSLSLLLAHHVSKAVMEKKISL